MGKYGIPYQGSKSKIADSIITFLPKGDRFVDLFGGGGAMSHCAVLSGKYKSVLYNELNPLLVTLMQDAISGKYNLDTFKPEWISREDFKRLKDQDGYVKYIWTFSNNGRQYLFSPDNEKIKRSLHNFIVFGVKDGFIQKNFPDIDRYVKGDDIIKRRLLSRRYMSMKLKSRNHRDGEQLQRLQQLEQLERLQQLGRLQQLEQLEQLERLELRCGSYLDYEYQDGDIVYCDSPYEGTAEYAGGFNHKEFYEWVATRPYQVWFSSYQNISDKRFKMVLAKGKTNLMAGATHQKKNYECIYTNKYDKNDI